MPTRRPLLSLSHASRYGRALRHQLASRPTILARKCSSSAPEPFKAAPPKSTADQPSKPDHRELGQAQKLFTHSPYSPGSPLFLPRGTDMFNKLTNFLRAQYAQFGFDEVITPNIYKKSLWEKSGHWDKYAKDMYSVQGRGATGKTENAEVGEDEEFGLKPMNCPGHCVLFGSEQHSYKELPVRYADFSALHRNEISGALSGLTRVRRFHQDDGHVFCRPSQIQSEIKSSLDFIGMVYKTFGLGPFKLVLSTRPEEHIGTAEEWERAENQLKAALDASDQSWEINPGDGAFYGPKIDIILQDSDGKEHQTATIQLDFQLPQRFNLSYAAPAPEFERQGIVEGADYLEAVAAGETGPVTPVVIHRAILGSVERFMALLIEHYNGKYPFWLSPNPAIILTMSDNPQVVRYAQELSANLADVHNSELAGGRRPNKILRPRLRIDVDSSSNSIGKKATLARQKGYNFILTIGEREMNAGETIALQPWNQPRLEELGSWWSLATKDTLEGTKAAPEDAAPSLRKGKNALVKTSELKKLFGLMQDHFL
ncbi:threonyl-tRNA synthetase [Phyllosticta capitalensis]